jgi:hypothetical protein
MQFLSAIDKGKHRDKNWPAPSTGLATAELIPLRNATVDHDPRR